MNTAKGPEMLCYMLANEVHHRGQMCMLAHQMGFPLPMKVAFVLCTWESLGKSAEHQTAPEMSLR